MAVEFTAQEIRNVLKGLEVTAPELDPFQADDTVYLERNLSDKTFKIYGTEPDDYVDPLITIGPGKEAEFGFINRYYMLRAGSFDPDSDVFEP